MRGSFRSITEARRAGGPRSRPGGQWRRGSEVGGWMPMVEVGGWPSFVEVRSRGGDRGRGKAAHGRGSIPRRGSRSGEGCPWSRFDPAAGRQRSDRVMDHAPPEEANVLDTQHPTAFRATTGASAPGEPSIHRGPAAGRSARCAIERACSARVRSTGGMPDHVHLVHDLDVRQRLAQALAGYIRWRNRRRRAHGSVIAPLPPAEPLVDAQKVRRSLRYATSTPAGQGWSPTRWRGRCPLTATQWAWPSRR
jgi:hypothetical protein